MYLLGCAACAAIFTARVDMKRTTVESGGAALPYQADVFPDKEHFGRIFFNSESCGLLNTL